MDLPFWPWFFWAEGGKIIMETQTCVELKMLAGIIGIGECAKSVEGGAKIKSQANGCAEWRTEGLLLGPEGPEEAEE